jgi:hypothetical protein
MKRRRPTYTPATARLLPPRASTTGEVMSNAAATGLLADPAIALRDALDSPKCGIVAGNLVLAVGVAWHRAVWAKGGTRRLEQKRCARMRNCSDRMTSRSVGQIRIWSTLVLTSCCYAFDMSVFVRFFRVTRHSYCGW